jgi:flagellar motility protein MotE (MotC chaperone)
MKPLPRILPLIAVAMGGVLAIKVVSSVVDLPDAFSSARAFAEGVAHPGKPSAQPGDAAAPGATAVASRPAAICAPTAAELAKEAGLSPAELQVLQSLGVRRGQLDQREAGMDTQLQLLAAAEAKLDAKIAALEGLKGEMNGLLGQIDSKQQAEVDRMVKVYEGMKPKDSAARFTLLDDAVRLPIAAKMKERALSAMLAQMSPAEAKRLTESLAQRFAQASAVVTSARAAVAAPTQAAAAPPPAAPPVVVKPAQTAQASQPAPQQPPKPAAPRRTRRAPAAALAAAKPPAAKPVATAQAAATAPATAAASPPKPATAPPKPAATTPTPAAASPATAAPAKPG